MIVTDEGIIANVGYELNDKPAAFIHGSGMLLPWNSILSVELQKSRPNARRCGSCASMNSKGVDGLSFKCGFGVGLLGPCCEVICTEKTIPGYSELTVYSCPGGIPAMQALINQDSNCATFVTKASEEKIHLVGSNISKVRFLGLLDVDQVVERLKRHSLNKGFLLPYNAEKIHIVYSKYIFCFHCFVFLS